MTYVTGYTLWSVYRMLWWLLYNINTLWSVYRMLWWLLYNINTLWSVYRMFWWLLYDINTFWSVYRMLWWLLYDNINTLWSVYRMLWWLLYNINTLWLVYRMLWWLLYSHPMKTKLDPTHFLPIKMKSLLNCDIFKTAKYYGERYSNKYSITLYDVSVVKNNTLVHTCQLFFYTVIILSFNVFLMLMQGLKFIELDTDFSNWALTCPITYIMDRKNVIFIFRRCRRPGDGRYCNSPLSVYPSVRQKGIAVFSRNFAGTCTKSWGCAV